MLLFAFSRAVLVLRSQDDFNILTSATNAYLARDVEFSLPEPVDFKNGLLDCMGHQIAAQTQIFGKIDAAMIRNCVFALEKYLATTISAANLVNVRVLSSMADKSLTTIAQSVLQGVRIRASSYFAGSAVNSVFVGCAFDFSVTLNSEPQALIAQLSNCTVQNVFYNTSAKMPSVVSFASLALKTNGLSISKSRFITEITISGEAENYLASNQISGCVGYGTASLDVWDSDFLMRAAISGLIEKFAGVLAYGKADSCNFRSISSYLMLSGLFQDVVAFSEDQYLCNFAAYSWSATVAFENITVINDIKLDIAVYNSNVLQEIGISGLLGYAYGANLNVKRCFSFGTIETTGYSNISLILAGLVAYYVAKSGGSILLYDCVYSGELYSNMAYMNGPKLIISGLVGFVSSLAVKLEHMHFYGNISAYSDSSKEMSVGAVAGSGFSFLKLFSCMAVANITFLKKTGYLRGTAGCLAGQALEITNSLVQCTFKVNIIGASGIGALIGLMAGQIKGYVARCSVEGALEFETTMAILGSGYISGCVGTFATENVIEELSIRATIAISEYITCSSSVLGEIYNSEVKNVVIIAECSNANQLVYYSLNSAPRISNLFIDCTKANLSFKQGECRDDLTNGGAAAVLGPAFAWNAGYNDGYLYLSMLPVLDTNGKYVLPDSGSFSADSYFVDDAGFPSPKTDFYPCRGACYGTYSSPVTRTCDDDFEYCIDVDRAKREFPDDSCITENAVCLTGVSFCSNDAELLKNEALSEYYCQNTCPSCLNGHCNQAKCVCDIYNEGETCTYKCNADQPVCFNDAFQKCNEDNTQCIAGSPCDNVACVHGTCVEAPIAHCECENLWAGDDCATCGGFGEDCDMTQEQCGAMVCSSHGACAGGVNVSCECKDLWAGASCSACEGFGAGCNVTQQQCDALCGGHGSCYYYQTTVCTCDAGFQGANCSQCVSGRFLDDCVSAEVCGERVCGGRGVCSGSSAAPSCSCAGLWQGEECGACSGFGPDCSMDASECASACCAGKADCHQECVGYPDSYECRCASGWFGPECALAQQQCANELCSSHGSCISGKQASCECDNLWAGDDCATCGGFGEDCDMTQEQCGAAVCSSHGACVGSFSAPTCECNDNFNVSTNCKLCNSAMSDIGGKCACGTAENICGTDYRCVGSRCSSSCKQIPNCLECRDPEFALCKRCSENLIASADGMSCVCNEREPACADKYFCLAGSCVKGCLLLDQNCIACVPDRPDQCAGCKNGFTDSGNGCEEIRKQSFSTTVIAVGTVGGLLFAAVVGLIVFLLLKRKQKKQSVSHSPSASQIVNEPKEIPKIEIVYHQQTRKLKKIAIKKEENLLGDKPLLYTADSQQKRQAKLQPVKQSGTDLLD